MYSKNFLFMFGFRKSIAFTFLKIECVNQANNIEFDQYKSGKIIIQNHNDW